MAGYLVSYSTPNEKYKKSTLSFLNSQRIFSVFSSKALTDTEAVMSPTSILDSKPFSCFKNPFWCESSTQKAPEAEVKHHWEIFDSQKIGLGIVDSFSDEKSAQKLSKTESRVVLFGSQLKIQIPVLPNSAHFESPMSPAEFGIKTRKSHLSRNSTNDFSLVSISSAIESLNRSLSLKEMELSEDYTCIICHGPNPGTTHIFDDRIIERCGGTVALSDLTRESEFLVHRAAHPSENFLKFCYTCKKNLEGEDIFIYSEECRHLEIIKDKEVDNMEPQEANGSFPGWFSYPLSFS